MASDYDKLTKQTKLFGTTLLQGKDELEEKLEKSHMFVVSLVSGLSERENHDALNQAVCKGEKEQEDVSLGLLFMILTDQANSAKVYRDLSFVSRDGLAIVVNKLLQIVNEKFTKLLDIPKTQLLWLLGEMMKNQSMNLEPVVHTLLRQIAGGDLSPGNLRYTENVLNLMRANRAWLDKNPGALQLVVYTFLRVIEDHSSPNQKAFCQAEVEFCVQLIRDKFGECVAIGKDFVRLLQNVFRIPEFMDLWKDILFRPQSLSPQFSGLPQLLSVRTPRKFLQSRVTPDVENKLAFLALKVKLGQQKRYQEWFFRQHLSSPENQTLLPDIVRFICGVIHPPNEILGSEVIPRWAILGWLYTAGQNPVSQSNMKLALFFDWLFFQGDKDNIMNIEPAMLLMHNSVRTHPNITYSLLDFICRMASNYCPQHSHLTKQGLFNSFKSILDKRVVSSLSPILKSQRMHRELKQLVTETLPSFLGTERPATSSTSDDLKLSSPPQSPTLELNEPSSPVEVLNDDSTSAEEGVFSDDEDEIPSPPATVEVKKIAPLPPSITSFRPINIKEEDFEMKIVSSSKSQKEDVITEMEEFQNLDSNLLKDNVLKLKTQINESSEAMEAIIANIESMGDFDDEIATPLCVCLANCLAADLSMPVIKSENYKLQDQISQKAIDESLERPQYSIFRSICALSKNDINLENIYVLLSGIHEIDQRIGYHFLYFLIACYNTEEKFTVYEDYVAYFKDRTLKTVLLQDLKACYEYDPQLFMYLIEPVFKRFTSIAVGNKDVIKMLVATVHPDEMCTLINSICLGDLLIIGENQVRGLLECSLAWSSFEQNCLWQLIGAEETPTEMLVNILPSLKEKNHCETLNHLLLLLRAESPQQELLKPVLCTPVEGIMRRFSLSVLKSWCQDEAREVAHLFAQMLTKPAAYAKKNKSSSMQSNPSTEQIVLHLNEFYNYSTQQEDTTLFQYESLRYALTQAKKSISDPNVKTKCKPLFAEFSDLSDRVSRKRKNRRLTRSTRTGGKLRKEESSEDTDSDESEESDDDDDDLKPKISLKKRKKSKNVSSDDDD